MYEGCFTLQCKVDGLIISNTTIKRDHLQSSSSVEEGGLSGKPLADSSTKLIKDMYTLTKGQSFFLTPPAF